MKLSEWLQNHREAVLQFLRRYKYVLAVIAAGLVLLLLPAGSGRDGSLNSGAGGGQGETGLAGASASFDLQDMERRLEEILSQVEGAGKVTVMLSLKSGMEQVLASDRSVSVSGKDSEIEEKTVILDLGDGEEAVVLTQKYPVYQGAVVVCPGGEDARVKLLLTQAVSALTGLGTDRITVCQGG